MITSLQCFTSLQALCITCGYMSLVTAMIAVAFTQFDKLTAAIQDIRQQHIPIQRGQENERVHKIVNCDLQDKLNACIRHHQEIME